MEIRIRMRLHVTRGDACITHNCRARSRFHLYARAFVAVCKGMVGAKLVAQFVSYIIDIEIVSRRNAIAWRGKSAAFP